jgi:hypothetical protein
MTYCEDQTASLYLDQRREDGTTVQEPVTASSLYHISLAIGALIGVAHKSQERLLLAAGRIA